MVDVSRFTFPSIALIKHSPDDAFRMIAGAGFKNVDVLEKMPHLSIHADECDPANVKAAADKHGLRITAVNSYVGGGVVGRAGAWLHHPGFVFPNKDKYTHDGFASKDPAVQEQELKHVCRRSTSALLWAPGWSGSFLGTTTRPRSITLRPGSKSALPTQRRRASTWQGRITTRDSWTAEGLCRAL